MSAAELRQAAETLRAKAADADPGCGWSFYDGGKRDDGTEPGDSGLIAWITLLSPCVGLALADWLDSAAVVAESYGAVSSQALDVARLINGGAA